MSSIYVDIDDEIIAVIDKLKNIKGESCVLHIPKDAMLLQSVVNLKLLKKESDKLGKKIKIKIASESAKKMVASAGIEVLGGVKLDKVEKVSEQQFHLEKFGEDAVEINSQKGKNSLEVKSYKIDNPKKPETDDESIDEKGDQQDATVKSVKIGPRFTWKWFLIISGIVLAGLVALWVWLPKANIVIEPQKDEIGAIANIIVDKNVASLDLNKGIIPGKELVVENEVSKTFDATGEKNTGNKASGKVTIYNGYSTIAHKIFAKTKIKVNEKAYLTIETVSVPGYTDSGGKKTLGQAEVSVEAMDPGEEYNIGPTTFIFPSLDASTQEKLYAKSNSSFTGGSTQMTKAVSEDDLKKAEENLVSEEGNKLKQKLRDDNKGYVVLDDAIVSEVSDQKSSKEKDEVGDQFTFTAKIKFKTIAFTDEDKDKIIENKVQVSVPDGMTVAEGSEVLDKIEVREAKIDEGKISAFIHITRTSVASIKTDEIASFVGGYEKSEAEEIIKNKFNVANTEVVLWPFWAKKVPRIASRVSTELR